MDSTRSAFVGAVGLTFIGQLVSVAYEIAVAARFGTTWEGDALALAFIVPFALSYEITVWIGSAFLPVYLHVRTREGPGAASALFFRSAISLVAFATLLTGGWVVGSPWLAALLTGHRAGEAAAVTLRLFRLFGLLLFLVPCSAFLARSHEAHRSFVLPAGRQFCWYGAALVAVLLATREFGLSAVPLGMTLGLAIYLGVLLTGLRRRIDDPGGLRGTPGEGDKRLVKLLPPLMVGSLATWLNVMVERALAARQGVGSLAALTYAFRLLNFPLTLFLLNATAILFPTLALHAARLERRALATLTARALRLTFFFVLPLAALAAALATPVVQVAFERGAFTRASTATTGLALALYAPGLVGLAGVQVLTRSYQALQLVPRMVTVAVIAAAANVAAMLVLTLQLGFVGIPLAWSLTSWLHMAGLLYGVRQELVGLDLGALFRSVLRCAVAAALAGGVAGVTVGLLGEGGPLSLLGGGLAGIAAYTLAVLGIAGEEARLALRTAVPSAFPSLPLRIEEP